MIDPNLAILWDMDGTLIDTRACHLSTWTLTLEKYGYELDRKVFDANFGRNTRTILPLLLGFNPRRQLLDQLMDEKEALFRKTAPTEATLVPGVEAWLADAKAAQIPQIVASSASMENITSMMSGFNLLDYFDFFISGDELPAKPAPDIFLLAATLLDQSPQFCWVIEDSIAGVRAAKAAGMTCVAVSTNHTKYELTLADCVVEDFTHPLAEVIHQLEIN